MKSATRAVMLQEPPASTPGEIPFPPSAPALFLRVGGRVLARTVEGVGVANRPPRPPHPGNLPWGT